MSNLKVINGKKRLADIEENQDALIIHTTGKISKIKFVQYDTTGITGFNLNLKNTPLTFYPFHNILEVKKSQ